MRIVRVVLISRAQKGGIVVAADQTSGIGLGGDLPWRLRKDMAHFLRLTSTVPRHGCQNDTAITSAADFSTQTDHGVQRINACIMGRKTWESIPKKFRPLSGRFNVIVSHDPHYLAGEPEQLDPMVVSATSFEAALDLVQSLQASSGPAISDRPSIQIERVFLIGGSQLYSEGIESKECKYIFLTRIHATVECDAFFPEINGSEYTLLSAEEARSVLEEYTQQILETTAVEEGRYSYEYTVYRRN